MVRLVESITSGWRFRRGDLPKPPAQVPRGRGWTTVNIPHTWNAVDAVSDGPSYYRGPAWYYKELRISAVYRGKRVFLYFKGVNQDTEVWLNGKQIGAHCGGYTAFVFDITSAVRAGTRHGLAVRVNNAHNEEVPPLGGDLCHFGGIYRTVHLVGTAGVHFDLLDCATSGVLIDTPRVTARSAAVRMRSRVCNSTGTARTIVLAHEILDPAGARIALMRRRLTLAAHADSTILQTHSLPKIKLWSPDAPHLYTVRSTLVENTGPCDEVVNPLGFRWFSVDAKRGFFLNGKHCFIKGIGKHQDYPGLGYAVPDDTHRQDAACVKAMGANLVRGHYPQPQVIYETCDRLGLMAWAKLPIMDRLGFTPAFLKNTGTMLREMILQNYNHPCIIFWGYACEVLGDVDWFWPKPQDPAAVRTALRQTRQFVRALERQTRVLDPARLTMNDYHTDPNPQWYHQAKLLDISHLNGWNIYQGWYHASLANLPKMLEQTRAYAPAMPYVLAEFGACSDYRCHTHEPSIFDMTTEYQEQFHRAYLREAGRRPWLAGMCIWTLFDFQVQNRMCGIPHLNAKGMLRADRTPKDVYFLFQAHWSATPMVHIATADWTRRIAVTPRGGTSVQPVRIYSNLAAAELFLNGRSLGVKPVEDRQATWPVPLHEGANLLTAAARQGTHAAHDAVAIDLACVPPDLRTAFPAFPLCIDVGQPAVYFTDPMTGNRWLPDRAYTPGQFGHLGGARYRTWTQMKAWDGIRDGVTYNITGTAISPVFRTFLLGLREYRLDAPDGEYEIDLLFCEPFPAERRRDPREHTGADAQGRRVFNVSVNGVRWLDHFNPLDFGALHAIVKSTTVHARAGSGIRVELSPITGQTLLSGITVRAI